MSQKLHRPEKAQQRFLRRGITKIYWLRSLADPKRPARKELAEPNCFDLTHRVSDIEGWTLSNEAIETPDMGSTFNGSIPGNDTAEDSSLTFYEDRASNEIEQRLSKGAEGWILLLRKGDVPGSPSADAFPVTVATRAATYTTDNEAAKFQVTFTVTDEPTLDAVVPEAGPHPLPHPVEHSADEGESTDVTVVSTTTTTATVHEHED
ncbi:hypothetical protein [Streptomyces sp. NPDC095613]|uniref:phage tail tube protein n=1 Tax=Streptomyces sp. NPDC095613 TaxID=3155540 RepID=UPI0033255A52